MDRREIIQKAIGDLSGVFVEVGTCWGGFAQFILRFTQCSKLYCVDPYKKYEMIQYVDALNTQTQEFMDDKFMKVNEALQSEFGSRVEMIRDESVPSSKKFSDGSLDFVYIDANHMYHAVLADLVAWYPKIRPGGVLAGDDVESLEDNHLDDLNVFRMDGDRSFGAFGVHKALVAFQKKHPDFDYVIEGNQFWWKKPVA